MSGSEADAVVKFYNSMAAEDKALPKSERLELHREILEATLIKQAIAIIFFTACVGEGAIS